MKKVDICLNSIDKVKRFVNIVVGYDGEFDLSSGRYIIDAKSIMGIFSLDLNQNIGLTIHDDRNCEDLLKQIDEFLVK